MRTDYRSGLLQVSASLHRYYGLSVSYEPDQDVTAWLEEHRFRCVIVMLVDALGAEMIRRLPADDFLLQFRKKNVMSVFPPTTTAATTSLLTGRSPAENGWMGWNQYFPEVDDSVILFLGKSYYSASRYPGLAERTVPVTWIMDRLNAAGIRAESVWPSFGRSHPCRSFEEECNVTAALSHKKDVRFIYTYWDGLDDLMHFCGTGDKRVSDEIARISSCIRAMAEILPGDAGLLVLADHGMTDITSYDLRRDKELCRTFRRPPSLEQRAVSFGIRPECRRDFEKLFYARFHDAFELLSQKEVIEAELFGPGQPHPLFRDFIGDYIAIARTPLSLTYGKPAMAGQHAGASEEEVMIPIVLYPQSKESCI